MYTSKLKRSISLSFEGTAISNRDPMMGYLIKIQAEVNRMIYHLAENPDYDPREDFITLLGDVAEPVETTRVLSTVNENRSNSE